MLSAFGKVTMQQVLIRCVTVSFCCFLLLNDSPLPAQVADGLQSFRGVPALLWLTHDSLGSAPLWHGTSPTTHLLSCLSLRLCLYLYLLLLWLPLCLNSAWAGAPHAPLTSWCFGTRWLIYSSFRAGWSPVQAMASSSAGHPQTPAAQTLPHCVSCFWGKMAFHSLCCRKDGDRKRFDFWKFMLCMTLNAEGTTNFSGLDLTREVFVCMSLHWQQQELVLTGKWFFCSALVCKICLA